MKKKILVFLFVISICLMHLNYYNVFAGTGKNVYEKIDFNTEWELLSINTSTFTIATVLDVPGIDKTLNVNEAINIYTILADSLWKGQPHPSWQQYILYTTDNPEKVRLEISIRRINYDGWCQDNRLECGYNTVDVDTLGLYMSEFFAGFYFAKYSPSDLMKNFLFAELYEDFAYETTIGLEKYYVYIDAQVYLPNGMKRSITVMPDVIDDNFELFEGYDFIAVSFNLSPRAQFWSPSIYPSDPITGLSYIVYDLVANTTTFYDYQGNPVYFDNRIMYIDNPQFFVPEAEALQYREKAAYEQGKNEGYKQGREEGERAGKRKMQEEMQQVIDNLTEYYEQELIKAYNRGKLEGANENFDIFGYLQALFGEQGLGRLLRLELLPGVSLGAVIMIPLAFWLVSFIMRWFR